MNLITHLIIGLTTFVVLIPVVAFAARNFLYLDMTTNSQGWGM